MEVTQAEGGEQGDPFMPILFSLGFDRALRLSSAHLEPGELAFAYLDDVYLLVRRDRAKTMFDRFSSLIERHAGVQVHMGKTRAWSSRTACPIGIGELGQQVWCGDKPAIECGLKMLGAPIGTKEYMTKWCLDRYAKVAELSDKLSCIEDPQSRWCLLKYCLEPRVNHLLRNTPPDVTLEVACLHDNCMWASVLALLNTPSAFEAGVSRSVISLAIRHGSLGLRSAAWTRLAAYWGAWADCLPFLASRFPDLANAVRTHLNSQITLVDCLVSLRAASDALRFDGATIPSWDELFAGARPQPEAEDEHEPGSFARGWQCVAAAARSQAEVNAFLSTASPSDCALVRSQSGRGAGDWLVATPTSKPLVLEPLDFLTCLRRRLLLEVPLSNLVCRGCKRASGARGHHSLACNRTGMIKRRALLPELAWVQICTEAGGSVKHRPLLNSLAIPRVSPDDGRELDLVVGRLVIFGGKTVIGDVSLRSPLSAEGEPKNGAERLAGSTFRGAYRDKANAYPELCGEHSNFTFEVLACEVGGHLSPECHTLIRQLVKCRASVHPVHLRGFVKNKYKRRWNGILSCAIQRAVVWNIAG